MHGVFVQTNDARQCSGHPFAFRSHLRRRRKRAGSASNCNRASAIRSARVPAQTKCPNSKDWSITRRRRRSPASATNAALRRLPGSGPRDLAEGTRRTAVADVFAGHRILHGADRRRNFTRVARQQSVSALHRRNRRVRARFQRRRRRANVGRKRPGRSRFRACSGCRSSPRCCFWSCASFRR